MRCRESQSRQAVVGSVRTASAAALPGVQLPHVGRSALAQYASRTKAAVVTGAVRDRASIDADLQR
jgi:hypothetical protein